MERFAKLVNGLQPFLFSQNVPSQIRLQFGCLNLLQYNNKIKKVDSKCSMTQCLGIQVHNHDMIPLTFLGKVRKFGFKRVGHLFKVTVSRMQFCSGRCRHDWLWTRSKLRQIQFFHPLARSSHRKCFIKKTVLKNFAIFAGKHLCQSLYLTKLRPTTSLKACSFIKKRLQHRCFPMNIAKF